jgi:Rab3 GTPase-activating protein catalytic subunit
MCPNISIAIYLIWKEFLREVRWHWENLIPIPRVPTETIDWSNCLIYQKLQMVNSPPHLLFLLTTFAQQLNYCIRVNKQRNRSTKQTEDEEEEEEEEKEEEEEEEKQIEREEGGGTNSEEGKGGWDVDVNQLFCFCFFCAEQCSLSLSLSVEQFEASNEPEEGKEKEECSGEGGLKPMEGEVSLASGKPLWIPITQDYGPATEDMIAEASEMGSEGDRIRAKRLLLSDMQAFKAANGDVLLEDFVRWHSPVDWLSDQKRLSDRMNASGNDWRVTWNEATPLPVSRQKPLFDAVVQAEKVIHYLETISPSDFLKQYPLIFLIFFFFSFYCGLTECCWWAEF